MNQFGQSRDACDRFSAAVELPPAILAGAWLPVLLVPLVARVPVVVADALGTVAVGRVSR